MGSSAPAPPGDGKAPDGEEDELEMTSIMDAEQRRELQKAARTLKAEAQPEPEELQRPTARPPPEAVAVVEQEVAIPKPQPIPAEALAQAAEHAEPEAPGAPEPLRSPGAAPRAPTPAAGSLNIFGVVAFVLLAAAVAYEFSR
jgi:hypothetical protein